jgi:iron-sulfur cluster assembly accessory protein
MLMMSDRAAVEMERIISEQKLGKVYLRVGVKGGGCSGFQYTLGFDDSKDEFDQVSIKEWQPEDLEMICDMKSFLYLNNTIIDFDESLLGRGFKFINPQASNSCGCGESFGV